MKAGLVEIIMTKAKRVLAVVLLAVALYELTLLALGISSDLSLFPFVALGLGLYLYHTNPMR